MTVEHIRYYDRDTWLALRRHDLTASDIAAVSGVDPYRSALAVFSEKRGLISTTETPIMRRGRWLEAAAHMAIVETHPHWKVIDPQTYLRDPDIRLGCTPDRIAEDENVPGLINLQIKSVSRPTFERWQGQVPLNYMLQTACEAMLLDARTSYLCAFVISTYEAELVTFEIPRHAGVEIKLRQTAVDFWRDMDAGLVPKPDFRRDGEVIAALYNQPKPATAIDLSGSNRLGEVLAERAMLKDRIKADSEEVSALENEIKYAIGDSEAGTLPGWRVTWKQQTRRAYTVPESTTRVLRVTDERGEEEAA